MKTKPMTDSPTLDAKAVVTERLETAFKGFFRIDRYHIRHRTFAGGWTDIFTRELFERGHAVACVLFDPKMDAVVMVEQFRIGAYAALDSPWFDTDKESPWLLEHVAGVIDRGETPEDVARRETREETGIEIEDLIPVHHCLMTPGGSSESCHLFCGKVDASNAGGIHGLPHENEDIKVHVFPTQKALDLMAGGRCNNAMTVIGLQWLRIHREDLIKRWG